MKDKFPVQSKNQIGKEKVKVPKDIISMLESLGKKKINNSIILTNIIY